MDSTYLHYITIYTLHYRYLQQRLIFMMIMMCSGRRSNRRKRVSVANPSTWQYPYYFKFLSRRHLDAGLHGGGVHQSLSTTTSASIMSNVLRRQRFKTLLIPALVVAGTLVYVLSHYHYQIRNVISYGTRPLWDTADGPSHVIPHYYAEGMLLDEHTCSLHGWKPRVNLQDYKLLDAILMSSELDLLEIRLNELSPTVDRFFIIESNATFTGLPKETYFANNRKRFAQFEKKISYRL